MDQQTNLEAQLDHLGATALRIRGDCDRLRGALHNVRQWIEGWQRNVASGCAPTPESLTLAHFEIVVALRAPEAYSLEVRKAIADISVAMDDAGDAIRHAEGE